MASGVPFHYLDLRAFCYVTEDEQRVERALRTYLPEDYPVDRTESEGHHGDRIVVLSARVENADDVRHVLDRVTELAEFDRILRELEERINDNNALFVRLDKQAAFNGRVALGDGLTLRGKVEAYPANWENAVENAREAFEDLGE